MNRRRVLVLRPQPGASETAARLEAAGFEPVVLPLSEIRSLHPSIDVDFAAIACAAATSANALRHTPEPLLDQLRGKPIFVVGEATARAAREAGFGDVIAGDDDGEALARIIAGSSLTGSVLYLCGAVRRPEFEQGLRAGGLGVLPIEVYDAAPINQSAGFAALAADGLPLAAMCHSPESARMLAGLIENIPGSAGLIGVVAISARAAGPLMQVGVRADVANEPTDQAMLAALG